MDYIRSFLPPLVAVLMMCLTSSLTLEVYTFYEGRDGSLEFNQPLSSESSFEYEVYLISASCFFCKNGTMVAGCLTPQQFTCFSVHGVRTSTHLTVTLSVRSINADDSQFYLFAMREDRNGKRQSFTEDAFVEVLRPPSPAECTVKPSEYSAALNEVNCTSLLASDGEGSLFCFQNAKKIPYKGTPVRLNDHVTWIFWMDARLPINCCSYEAKFPVTSESCSQFVYQPPTNIPESENSRNPSSNHTTTPEEIYFSPKSTDESNCATTIQQEAFTKNTLVALVIFFPFSL
ncbi:uncharacterized protein [Diadema setosum]|uniref:uncharacterized protein n=1 Tax=Diadema setosum TaxID=31175 RepID=UPI003B3A87D3